MNNRLSRFHHRAFRNFLFFFHSNSFRLIPAFAGPPVVPPRRLRHRRGNGPIGRSHISKRAHAYSSRIRCSRWRSALTGRRGGQFSCDILVRAVRSTMRLLLFLGLVAAVSCVSNGPKVTDKVHNPAVNRRAGGIRGGAQSRPIERDT